MKCPFCGSDDTQVIAKYFEKLLTTTASRDVRHAQLVAGAPSYTKPW